MNSKEPVERKVYYEGYVKLCDEGYYKSLYINSMVPVDKDSGAPFFIGTKENDSWILILVKALAKYYGSYDNLSKTDMNSLCIALFGSKPFNIGKAFNQIYRNKQ